MKKIIISIIMVLVSVSYASAFDFKKDGIAYNILSDGTLSVTHVWKDVTGWINGNTFTATDPRGNGYLYTGTVKIPSTVKHKGKEYKVTEIGFHAFYCCERLTKLILPEGLRRIEFQSIVLTRIKSLNIPSTVTEIVPGAITQCKFLAELTVSPGNPKYVSKENCIYTKDMKQLVMVSPTLKTYQFPPTVTSVADFAFDYSSITRLVIPPSVEYIGGEAFPMSSFIGSIVCDHILKKLPNSDDFAPTIPLPLWAIGKGKYKPIERTKKEYLWDYPYSIYNIRATQRKRGS